MMVFNSAINEMEQSRSEYFGPISFQSYLDKYGLPVANTAPVISVDALSKLPPELRQRNLMVFRLGRDVRSRNTCFALARSKSAYQDFFLDDELLAANICPELFIPLCAYRDLFPFQLLPALTEASLVNLALASGLLGCALNLDSHAQSIIPATGQSTFSFDVRPHEDSEISWRHEKGQVEIDAMFVARRAGREVMFVVEAKVSDKFDSLAKHKLVYPVLAVQPHVPASLPIVPVYLRIVRSSGLLNFYVTECCMSTNGSLEGFGSAGDTKWFHLSGFNGARS